MKASYAVPFVFVLAAACSDAPTGTPTSLAPPKSASGAFLGNPPPPPVDASVVLCSSASSCVVVDGAYFNNDGTGALAAVTALVAPTGDGVCNSDGPAWLRFNNHQEDQSAALDVTANGQIRCSHLRASGKGTITFDVGDEVVVKLDQILFFAVSPDCTAQCAHFTATATINGEPGGFVTGDAFNREYFEENCQVIPTEGGQYVSCGSDIG